MAYKPFVWRIYRGHDVPDQVHYYQEIDWAPTGCTTVPERRDVGDLVAVRVWTSTRLAGASLAGSAASSATLYPLAGRSDQLSTS